MGKLQRKNIILLIILVQTIISISVGLTVLFLFSYNLIPSGVYVGKVYVGGLSKTDAVKKIENSLGDVIHNKSLSIKYGKPIFNIKFSDVDAAIDSQASADASFGNESGDKLINMFMGYFSNRKKSISPVITLNEGKLREKLSELKLLVDKDSKNASIHMDGQKIIKTSEITGYNLDIDKSVDKIMNNLGTSLYSPIEFNSDLNSEIKTLLPAVTLKSLKDITGVVAQYSTDITVKGNTDSIAKAVSAINNTVVNPLGKGSNSEFSFIKCLDNAKVLNNQNDEGYNQVASTLYAAALVAGINQNTISRAPHEETVDYIEPGLDVLVSSGSQDLRFRNSLGSTIVILAKVNNNKVVISILGKKNANSTQNVIKTEVQQVYAPTVISMENQDLKPGQKKMLTSGKKGIKVNVYRMKVVNNKQVDKQLLYYDQYKPVDAVVQIGPNTNWYDNQDMVK